MNSLMIQTGTIVKIKNNKAILLTDQCEVVCIKKQPGMYEGLEIRFENSEILNNKRKLIQYSPIAGSIAAVFVFVILLVNSLYLNPHNIYAYVEVDTNACLEFIVDEHSNILDVKPLNKNAEDLIKDLELKSKSLETALTDTIEKSAAYGLINGDSKDSIVISAFLENKKASQNQYANLLSIFRETADSFTQKNIKPYIIEISPNDRKLSSQNKISMGRYIIYKRGLEQGLDLTIDEIRICKIGEILEKVHIEDIFGSDKDKLIEPTDSIQPSPSDNAIEKTPGEPSSIPSQMPSIAPLSPSPSGGELKLDTNIEVNYDISIIETMELEYDKSQKELEKIMQASEQSIAQETSNAQSQIDEIKQNNDLDWRKKQEEINKIKWSLQNKITQIRKKEKEQISSILDQLNKKEDDLFHN